MCAIPSVFRYVFIFISSVLAPAAIHAEPVTLPQAVQMALTNNRQLLADGYRVDAAAKVLDQANARLLPRLDLGYAVSRTDSPLQAFGTKLLQGRITAQDFNPALLNNPAAVNNHQPRLTVSMPLYQGGALWAGRDGARAGSEAARHQHAWMQQQIVFQTIRLFAQLRNVQAQLAATEKALQAARDHLKTAQAMQRRGMLIAADVMDAEVHKLNVEVRLHRLQNMEAQAKDALRLHLGMPPGAEVNLAGDVDVDLSGVEQEPMQALVAQAIARREDVLALEARLRAAEAGIDQARAGFLPRLSVQATREWNSATPGFRHGNTTLAAVVDMNVFAGGADRAALGRAKAERARLAMLLTDHREQVGNEVRNAWRALQESLARQGAMHRAFEQARESLRIVRLRHERGLEKTTELLDAQSRADQAEAGAIQARFDTDVARARVLLVAGLLSEERVR